jgi:Zn finger protein HypA/HybF involved in hydrogenase expression
MQCCRIDQVDLKKIDDLILDFIWKKSGSKKRVERISRIIMMKPTNCGGFGLPRAKEIDQSIKLKQFLRSQCTMHVISYMQKEWLAEPVPFAKSKTDEPVTKASIATLSEHAIEYLNRAEALNEVVPWLSNINIQSIPKIVDMNGIPRILLKSKMDIALNLGEAVKEANNGNIELCTILRPFKEKYKNLYDKLLLTDTQSTAFKLTDKNQQLEINNKLSSKVIRSCIMSMRYNTLDHITIEKSYMIPDLKVNHVKIMLSNVSKIMCTRNKNTFLRIINGDWFTNVKLHKYALKESAKCDHCQKEEDREHLFVECERSRVIWESFYRHVHAALGTKLEINISNILCIGNNASSQSIITLTTELLGLIGSKTRPKLNEKAIVTTLNRLVQNELAAPNKKVKRIWVTWSKYLQNQVRTIG